MAAITAPATARRWQYTSTKGGLEKNLKLNESWPVPKPRSDQHLVKVLAVGLNPVDYKPAESFLSLLLISKPATPGIDFAGRVVTPAAGSSLKPGQLVFGAAASIPFAAGGLSQYTTTPKGATIAVPDGLGAIDAASIPVAGLTAYQTIVPRVKKGDHIFINGGSGGVGIFGIQIAKAVGCQVTTSCSTPNVELCRSLGADQVIDYKKGNVVDQLVATGVQFDHVVDNVGSPDSDLYWRCHEYTKSHAAYVMVAGSPTTAYMAAQAKRKYLPGFLGGGKRKCEGFLAQVREEDGARIASWMVSGEVRPIIDATFPFEEAPRAFERLKTGRARGKVMVLVDPEETKSLS